MSRGLGPCWEVGTTGGARRGDTYLGLSYGLVKRGLTDGTDGADGASAGGRRVPCGDRYRAVLRGLCAIGGGGLDGRGDELLVLKGFEEEEEEEGVSVDEAER